jgi:hypothetical protein
LALQKAYMIPDITGIIIAALAFTATFFGARWLGRGLRERRRKKAAETAHRQESRQVRRARQRKA